jgi:predicted aldo/keto reductase-like oxidoreductase
LEKRRLGRTDLEVTRIGFGGIPIDKRSRREAEEAVERALELGINFFDTARAYGTSEEKIGSVLSRWQGRRLPYLATKTYQRDRSGALADLERSLRNLQVEKIDLYQLHQIDDEEALKKVLAPRGALDGLKEAKRAGKIDWIGVTGHRPDVLCRTIETGEFDTVQAPLNIVDHYIFDTEETLLPLARRLDLGIIAMKPLAGGKLKEISRALRFALSREADVVIPGLGSPSEVEEAVAVGSAYRPLSSLELRRLLEEAQELGTEFCRQCGYCLPCPSGIDIPTIFRLEGCGERYDAVAWASQQYRDLAAQARDCEECGECEPRCPYRLPIRQKLKQAEGKLLRG